MNAATIAVSLADRLDLPDALVRAGIWALCRRTRLAADRQDAAAEIEFARAMDRSPVARDVDAANAQHYEIPAEFFGLVLGPHRKYSACLFDDGASSLGEAEARALKQTCDHAGLLDGETILELGCGWGSLSLWMAQNYPASRILAVSNSHSQRRYIEQRAAERGFNNLSILTADMNHFDTDERFDRIVSVEMFEHMSNWRALLTRARDWLSPSGRLFLHVFSHRSMSYRFNHEDPGDWIAQHFFTGGIMPGHTLIRQFGDIFTLEREWVWNGENYARTARAWLANFDANRAQIDRILTEVYGADAPLWRRRWRLFFLATEGLFGHDGGQQWAVSHYLLKPAGA